MIRRSSSITINFATRNYRFWSRVVMAITAFSAAFACTAVIVVWNSISFRAEIGAMKNKVDVLTGKKTQWEHILREREQLTTNLNSMTALVDARRFSWTQLFTDIEALFPVGAALESLEFNRRDHALLLAGKAQSPETLKALIAGMEKSSSFTNPVLKHQSLDKGHISFDVAGTYQEHKTPGLAPGK